MWSEDICLHIAFCPPTGQRTAISTGRHGHSELKRTGRRRLEGAISNQVHDLQQLLLPYILGQAAQPLYRIPVRRRKAWSSSAMMQCASTSTIAVRNGQCCSSLCRQPHHVQPEPSNCNVAEVQVIHGHDHLPGKQKRYLPHSARNRGP